VDPGNSWATMVDAPWTMTIAPGGMDGFLNPEDHTIDVYVRDGANAPVELLAEDIWLEHPDVVWCPGGVIADSSTYAPDAGHTTFTGTPHGGIAFGADCSAIAMEVFAAGVSIEALPLSVNSPDIDGNLQVDIIDFCGFGDLYNCFSDCDLCLDYDESGTIDIADFGIFATLYHASFCP
jgi:hypothetical protein